MVGVLSQRDIGGGAPASLGMLPATGSKATRASRRKLPPPPMLRAREEKLVLLGCQLLENALGDVEVRMDLIDIVVILQRVH